MRISIQRWIAAACTLALSTLLLAALLRPTAVSAGATWPDFVRFGGITYVANGLNGGRALATTDLGPVFATVRFTVAGTIQDPSYRPKDGDAALLPVGTPVYSVRGYRPSFRLAVRTRAGIVLYEADTNPRAKMGAELLDIAGKVRAIGIHCLPEGMARLATITNPALVSAVVATILDAPVDQRRLEPGPATYVLAFSLRDGSVVIRPYWSDVALLGRGILLPPAFRAALDQGMRQVRASHQHCPVQASGGASAHT
ncbi:MAG: hypothetical protein JWO59_1469 [Chloroflexi bacterium]|nr:hypothetical protein [Chloroflexota bacterium]